jgi:hypothetical protein
VRIDSAIADRHARPPRGIDQAFPAKQPAAIAKEYPQQAQFERSNFDFLPGATQLGAAEVHFAITEVVSLDDLCSI